MILSFLIGFITGVGVVGTTINRQLAVHSGNVGATLRSSISNSIFYYASVHFVAKQDIVAYAGVALGSILISVAQAQIRRKNDSSTAGKND